MNGAHYSQQHIALRRFIKKHDNQSPCHSSLFRRWEKASKQGGDPHRKTDTETGNRTFGLSFQSSGITAPIFYQNSLIYQKRVLGYFSQCCFICLHKQMRSWLDRKALINMLISFVHQNHFLRKSSPWLLQSLPHSLELPCQSPLSNA